MITNSSICRLLRRDSRFECESEPKHFGEFRASHDLRWEPGGYAAVCSITTGRNVPSRGSPGTIILEYDCYKKILIHIIILTNDSQYNSTISTTTQNLSAYLFVVTFLLQLISFLASIFFHFIIFTLNSITCITLFYSLRHLTLSDNGDSTLRSIILRTKVWVEKCHSGQDQVTDSHRYLIL